MTDHDLIHEFAASRSEQAFRQLVDRHCDLVFSVARRVTQDAELARDVSQQVFCKLAAKPKSVPPGVPLAAWLHRSCRSLAIDMVRSEQARRTREAKLSTPVPMNPEPTPDWSRLEPVIDSLIDQLPETERRALVMRFYEKRSHGAIGAMLGLSEDAARKRLERALDRLRGLLAKRGISTSAAALASMLPAHATAPAPAGLSAALSKAALSSGAASTALTTTLIAIMSHKATIAGATLLLLAGVSVVVIPKMTRDRKPASAAEAASAAPAAGSAGSTGTSAQAGVRGRSRGSTAGDRLTEKYGESRTKLSAHLSGEFIALLEDTMTLMELAQGIEGGMTMASEPGEIFGDKTAALTLTEDQEKRLGELQLESMERELSRMKAAVAKLKADTPKMMEALLLQDSFKRGEIGRAEYKSLRKKLDLPEQDVEFTLGGGASDDPLEDEVFAEEVLRLLNEEQAAVFQEIMAGRKEKEALEEEEPVTSLEELEAQLSSGRKMIGGALQLMEGMKEGESRGGK